MKLLLLSPPYLKDYMRNARCDFVSLSGTQWFPILLGYAGAFLESKGFEVKLIDAPSYGLNFNDTRNLYDEYGPDFLAIYAGDKSRDSDIAFADRLIEKSPIPAAFVGPYFSIEPEYFLKKSKNINYGITSEFEYPLYELIKGRESAGIKNLVWRDGAGVKTNGARPYLGREELDAIPFVSEFFNRHLNFKYYKTPSEPHPFMDILTGRGCVWGTCTYCLWVNTFVRGRTYNTRSIGNVMEELVFIEKNMPMVRSIMIQDDTFPKERAIEFCEEKLKRGIKIIWSCYARADLDLDTLKLMKRAGCLNMHVGFESASDAVLRRVGKGLSKERMTRFAHDVSTAGLRIHGDFLIGLPGETEKSLNDLIRWACAIRPETAQFQVFIPFKGTGAYKELANHPVIPAERLEEISKKAYRAFYFSPFYLMRVLKDPYNLVFKKLGIIIKSLNSVFARKLNIR